MNRDEVKEDKESGDAQDGQTQSEEDKLLPQSCAQAAQRTIEVGPIHTVDLNITDRGDPFEGDARLVFASKSSNWTWEYHMDENIQLPAGKYWVWVTQISYPFYAEEIYSSSGMILDEELVVGSDAPNQLTIEVFPNGSLTTSPPVITLDGETVAQFEASFRSREGLCPRHDALETAHAPALGPEDTILRRAHDPCDALVYYTFESPVGDGDAHIDTRAKVLYTAEQLNADTPATYDMGLKEVALDIQNNQLQDLQSIDYTLIVSRPHAEQGLYELERSFETKTDLDTIHLPTDVPDAFAELMVTYGEGYASACTDRVSIDLQSALEDERVVLDMADARCSHAAPGEVHVDVDPSELPHFEGSCTFGFRFQPLHPVAWEDVASGVRLREGVWNAGREVCEMTLTPRHTGRYMLWSDLAMLKHKESHLGSPELLASDLDLTSGRVVDLGTVTPKPMDVSITAGVSFFDGSLLPPGHIRQRISLVSEVQRDIQTDILLNRQGGYTAPPYNHPFTVDTELDRASPDDADTYISTHKNIFAARYRPLFGNETYELTTQLTRRDLSPVDGRLNIDLTYPVAHVCLNLLSEGAPLRSVVEEELTPTFHLVPEGAQRTERTLLRMYKDRAMVYLEPGEYSVHAAARYGATIDTDAPSLTRWTIEP